MIDLEWWLWFADSMISVVFPACNEEENVEELHSRLKKVLGSLGEKYEIIAVDDGSTDATQEKLLSLSPIKVVVLSRNYGQNSALDAGLKQAKGNIVITIDGDLQNPPEEIVKLLVKLKEGYDAVVGWRKNRHDPLPRKIFSKFSNSLISRLTGVKLHDFSCALKCYRREYIDEIRLLGETFIFLPLFALARGARLTEVEIRHEPRRRGLSKHNLKEMTGVLFDLLTVKFLLSYFGKPLRFFGSLAFIFWSVAFLGYVWATVLKLMDYRNYSDTPLPLLGTMFVILGVIVFMMGLLAEVLLRIYHRTENVSFYSIKKVVERT